MAEDILRITGGVPLHGEVTVQGAKNSVLPIMAAGILCGGETVLHRVPQLSDVYAASRILNRLGCSCRISGNTVVLNASGLHSFEIPDADMRKMRSSIVFLGPLLGRCGECVLTMPGGCELGPRPIDMHLDALRQMGVTVTEQDGKIRCKANRLHGAKITLSYPSVGVTENVLMAAAAAEGETVLRNAAREPEITDLAGFLNACGTEIRGAGESTVTVSGKCMLHGAEYRIMPDRIAAVTWLCAGAAAGGTVVLRETQPADMESCLEVLTAAGCRLGVCGDRIFLESSGRLRRVRQIRTMPYPGFPTDAQPLFCAVLCRANGTSVIEETVFESRYKYIGELLRMGADIRVSGRTAVITGREMLHGADVTAPDLRGGAALAVAAVSAEGETVLRALPHIDRGYEHFAEIFHSLGGNVNRGSFTRNDTKNSV
ncbi:MAG: UDP-N-acetylglucosamine 1-carboxyvinyltransferase [Oscillospiraceae bacterium]|nr:UDP-N-acetylglucosamine 1-carboxyvinyltransferase [Oscillospiraceae bacterium]